MTDWLLYPHMYEETMADPTMVQSVIARPNNASYKVLDDLEMVVANHYNGIYPGNRDRIEVMLHWMRWRIAGRQSFLIGPETTARIIKRVKDGDIPTTPVPPAYFEFSHPPVNYAASKPLHAAMISRGIVGRITFLTDTDIMTEASMIIDNALTVLLPSVLQNKDLDHLKKGMNAVRGDRGVSKEAKALAQSMGLGEGPDLDEFARHFEALGDVAKGRSSESQMDISASFYDSVYGKPAHRPNPLLPKAARIIMVAADAARKADSDYGAPQYRDTNMVERNWMETGSQPIALRDGPVTLP